MVVLTIAFMPSSNLYIEKDLSINEEIEKLKSTLQQEQQAKLDIQKQLDQEQQNLLAEFQQEYQQAED